MPFKPHTSSQTKPPARPMALAGVMALAIVVVLCIASLVNVWAVRAVMTDANGNPVPTWGQPDPALWGRP